MNRILRLAPLLVALVVLAPPSPAEAAEPSFGAYWHDGKAELDGYRITVDRYGHPRPGRGVAIYVTEPFSRSRHVKLDDPARTPADAQEVLKLNLIRDFQTGIYEYRTILSLFTDTETFTPLKTTFSSSEWCGQVFEESHLRGGKLTQRVASYFEGEDAERSLAVPTGGIQEDQLFFLLRGLRTPYLKPGATRTTPFLASPFYRRLAHQPTQWGRATLTRLARAESVRVPAGTFETDVYVIKTSDGREGRFHVERAHPRRIVRWAWTRTHRAGALGGTDAGELTGSTRLEYWKTHDPGDERLLKTLGLEAPIR